MVRRIKISFILQFFNIKSRFLCFSSESLSIIYLMLFSLSICFILSWIYVRANLVNLSMIYFIDVGRKDASCTFYVISLYLTCGPCSMVTGMVFFLCAWPSRATPHHSASAYKAHKVFSYVRQPYVSRRCPMKGLTKDNFLQTLLAS